MIKVHKAYFQGSCRKTATMLFQALIEVILCAWGRALIAFTILTLALCRPVLTQPNRHIINANTARKLVRQAVRELVNGTLILLLLLRAFLRNGKQRKHSRSLTTTIFYSQPLALDMLVAKELAQ